MSDTTAAAKAIADAVLKLGVRAFAEAPRNHGLRASLEKILGPIPDALKEDLGLTAEDEAKYQAWRQEAAAQGSSSDRNEAGGFAQLGTGEERTEANTMSRTDTDGKKEDQFKNVEIVRAGEQIIIPPKMTLKQARVWLERREVEEEQEIAIDEIIEAFPLEGAFAFAKAIAKKYGFSALVPTPGFFGSTPPVMIGVDTDFDKTEQVPWGRVEIPGIAGYLSTDIIFKDNRLLFQIGGEVKQKHKLEVQELANLTRRIVKDESIYRGKAIRISFPDPAKKQQYNPRDCPKFMQTKDVKVEELIFSADVKKAVSTSLFNLIEHTANCRKYKVPLKRGILLEGPFGTGKTLTAHVAAKKCVENGWTFIYLDKVRDLKTAIHFAKSYQPAVIFAEDLDRVMDGERDEKMDEILNTIDGVDTKGMEVVVCLTTNHVDHIEPAMMRPGRLDAIISIKAPDAEAALALVNLYARGRLDQKDSYAAVGRKLEGQIPAVIREVVERSKLAAIGRLQGAEELLLRASDLEFAADEMLNHLRLMTPKPEDKRSDIEKAADRLGGHLNAGKSNGNGKHEAPSDRNSSHAGASTASA